MAEPSVLYEARDGIATITLNRPDVLNAIHHDLVALMAERVEAAAADKDVWVVVVRGRGRAFCSGMDRKALSAGKVGEAFYRHWIRALNGLEDMDKLVIGVLHGYSIGGGLQLAVACDLRLAADDAILGLGATRHGLIPDGSILRLARIVGLGRAKELTLLNDHIGPETALAMGLVNWVVPAAGLDAKLGEIVEKAFGASRTATGHAKRLLHASFHANPREMIEEVVRAQQDCMGSWELEAANRAWEASRQDVRFYPRPDQPPARTPRP
jgi:enoyl-CoA hydratase/carnithine racemase